MNACGTRVRRIGVGLAVTVGSVAITVRTIDALFTSEATAAIDLTVSAPVIPRPATVSCATSGGLIPSANLSWTHPGGGAPQPTQYVVRLLDNGVAVEVARVSGSTTSLSISTTTLGGALANILSLILGGQTRPITVDSVYGSFESPTAYLHRVQSAGLGGLGCSAIAGFAAGGVSAPVDTTTTTAAPTSTTGPTTTTVPTTTPPTTAAAATTTMPATSTIATTSVPPTTTITTTSAPTTSPTTSAPATTLSPTTSTTVG